MSDRHKSTDALGILITNVFMDNRNSDQCLQVISEANPDLVLVLEASHWWDSKLQVLDKEYPYSIKVPLDNTYGLLLFSKLKLIDPQVRYLVQKDVPSVKVLVELKSGKKVMFYGVHPKPPAPQESDSSIPRDAELIIVGREAKEQPYPVIVAGDLNDVAWSHTTHLFQKISGLLDPRIGRGMFPTFNAKYPVLRWPLDHLFHSEYFCVQSMKRHRYIGSDHFPICVKLYYCPEKLEDVEKPEATQEEQHEATEKVLQG